MAIQAEYSPISSQGVQSSRAPRRQFLEQHFSSLLPLPAALTIGLLILFPLAFNLYMSLHSWFVSSTTPPAFVGVKNFVEIFGKDARFWNAVWITVKFTAIGV